MDIEGAEARAARVVERGAVKLTRRRQGVAFGKAARHSRQFLGDCRDAGDMKLSRAIFMADWLGMTLEELIDEAEQGEAADGECLKPPKKKPKILKMLARRDPGDTAAKGNVEISSELRHIDSLRYENPVRALNAVQRVLADLAPEQWPFALNVASSCYRMTFEFGASALCARSAQGMAERYGNDLALGNALQRWVYLLCDVGQYKKALAFNSESRDRFIAAGSARRLAESVIDQSFCLHKMGEYQRALHCTQTAAAFVDILSVRNNVTRLMTAAACYMNQGQVGSARKLCQDALQIAEPHGNILLTTKTTWVLGMIEGSAGNPDLAEKLILPTIHKVMKHYPADAIVALLRLSVILLENHREERCSAILSQLTSFIEEFHGIAPIEEAIADLVALTLMRRITRQAVEGALRQIHSGRAEFFYARAA